MNSGFQGFGGSGGLGAGGGGIGGLALPCSIMLCDPWLSLFVSTQTLANTAVTAANTVYYVPFTSPIDFKITKIWTVMTGGSPVGNFDFGIYKGNALMAAQGSVAVGSAGSKSLAVSLLIQKNIRYYAALACTNNASDLWMSFALGTHYADTCGVYKETTYPLPASSTKATIGAATVTAPVLMADIIAP